MPRVIIDDLAIDVPEGTKVIEAAERLGIMIPRFCYHEALGAVGACRMCAVKFIHGPFKGVQMSCMIDAMDGMVVSTTDKDAVEFRRYVIEWLMINHPHDCPVCDEGGQCLLQDETVSGGHSIRRFLGKKRTYRDQYLGEFIKHEMNRCIHCYRCSRFYQEFTGYRDLGAMQIGDRVYFGRFSDGRLESPFSGNLVDVCPTGVYTDKPARYKVRRWDLQRSSSLCVHCSLGCNTIANARYRAVMRIEGRFSEAVNGFFICDRGRFGFSYVNGGASLDDRPRRARIDNREVDLDEAIRTAADRMVQTGRQLGQGAVACLGSTRSSLETLSMLSRLCKEQGWMEPAFFTDPATAGKVKTAVSRLDERLAGSLRQIERADFIVAVGVDPVNDAPMLALAMRQAYRKDAPVVMIDPRPVSLPLGFAHLAVAPRDMDTCLSVLIRSAVAKEDLEGQGSAASSFYDALPSDYQFDARIRDLIVELAGKLRQSRRPIIVCGTDIVSETTPALAADLALLLSGRKDHAGLFYILPGANAFGAALLTSKGGRSSFSDIVEAIENGSVKVLVVVESDPFRSFPDRQRLGAARQKLDQLIVMDYLPSETVRHADIFLPTSTIFEEVSSFINQEGRMQHGEAVDVGGIPIFGSHPPRVYSNQVPGGEPTDGWRILLSLGRDMSLPLTDIATESPLQWMAGESPALAGLRERQYPIDGIRVIPERSDDLSFSSIGTGTAAEVEERPDDLLQLLLVDWTFGTEELSCYSDLIWPVESEPCITLHDEDAGRAGLADGDRVLVQLDRGEVEVKVCVSKKMARGVMVLPRHRRLEWQKLKSSSAMAPLSGIKKMQAMG